jgi:uncharacterized membrane protein
MGYGHLDNEVHQHHDDQLKDSWTGKARTDEILAEAQRRIETREEPAIARKRATAQRLNQGVYWLSRHWVALFNVIIALYTGGAILAPVMMHWGRPGIANALYAFYKPFCHQYPFRSWFLFGPAFIRPLHEPISILKMNQLGAFVGNAEIGYKMALCERDIAIYGMMAVAGMLYGIVKKRLRIPPLALWLYFLFGVMPMMLDGGIQWISYALWQFFPGLLNQPFETIPLLRALTGSLFGLGVIAVGYPYMNEYFEDVQKQLETKYTWQA